MTSNAPRRGQLFFVDLEDIGRKLVLIVSDDEVNDLLNPVVCFVTATDRERTLPTYVKIDPPEGGVWKPSTILCHAIFTTEAWRLASEPIGAVSTSTMQRVDKALANALSLTIQEPPPEAEGSETGDSTHTEETESSL